MGLAQRLRSAIDEFSGAQNAYDDYDDSAEAEGSESLESAPRPLALVGPPHVEFALIAPQTFEEAQQIADHFKADRPVVVNLEGCPPDLARRLVDFCSGLIYALEGRLRFVGKDVVLLAPHHVELPDAHRGGLHERRFFNQA